MRRVEGLSICSGRYFVPMLTGDNAAGFWSYAQIDDARSRGRISRLAGLIKDEYALLTGADITIFLDRETMGWGDELQRRIAEGLQSTTFFIPVLTPTYFVRPECRKEFQKFTSEAKALGVTEYLLSIRYVPVSDMTPDSDDPLKAIAATMLYESWDAVRLLNEDSTEHMAAVNKLATRLVDLSRQVSERPAQTAGEPSIISIAVPDNEDDDAELGILDHMAALEQLGSEWTQTTEDFNVAMTELSAVIRPAAAALAKADKSSAKLAIATRLAHDLDPLIKRMSFLGADYSRQVLEMDPAIRAIIHYGADHLSSSAADSEEARAERESISGARDVVSNLASTLTELSGNIEVLIESMQGPRRLSRELAKRLSRLEASLRGVADARQVVMEWDELFAKVLPADPVVTTHE